MKRKGTKKGSSRKAAKAHDLKTRARRATSVKGGAVSNVLPGSSKIVDPKSNLQLDSCWLEGPARKG